MIYTTKGIVLKKYRHNSSSIAVDIYTQLHGKQKYIIKNFSNSKNKISISNFNNLCLLDIVATDNKNHFIHYIREVKSTKYYIEKCIIKLNISFFISEILDKILEYKLIDIDLFEYVYQSIKILNSCTNTNDLANFPLIFITNITKYLGFYPIKNWYGIPLESLFFDMKEARFTSAKPSHGIFMNFNSSQLLIKYLETHSYTNTDITSSRQQKLELTKNMLIYYKVHNILNSPIKSLEVLEALFN